MTQEVRLPSVPALGPLYTRALARAAQAYLRGRTPTTLPDVRYRVDGATPDADALAGYQRLLGEPGTEALPAGYVHVLAFPLAVAVMARDDFPLPLLGLVHLANRVEQRVQLHADDRLDLRAWAQQMRAHRSGSQVELVVEARRAGTDELAWRGVSTYLAKGVRVQGLEPIPDGDRLVDAPPPPATGQWRLAADVGRRYAAVSGDRNPIHTSRLGARLFGFPRPIAHGMYTAARALSVVGPARGAAFDWTVEFGRPVLLPGTLALGIETLDGGGHRYAGWNARSGKVHLAGSVTPR